ncbi:2-phosphosulfolactate phosphatase [Paenibacillus lutrae]|uniref:Probable 2-phosphosulfolactate phosphatase n=1 Tax=Paenibacillus lutrae TaxID=2078573 RepID=A0A7X3FIL4_9BACL|nr:2-phosphosulfolactate phosphatase [Paenibacillus lutrae]MVP00169.1 2-phosphosulfolactate phosphatase [Paenibacillus lutrae]
MRIDVIPFLTAVHPEDLAGKTVLVIDVLRATTTILAALGSGSSCVVPVETVEEALELHTQGDVLGGERGCERIAGFDLGNSPLEYTPAAVEGRRVILTTTNGTRALQKASQASHVAAASLLNGAACAQAVLDWQRDAVILCAGTRGAFCLEDGLCAGQIVSHLLSSGSGSSLSICDFSRAMAACYTRHAGQLAEALTDSDNGRRLSGLGFRADLEYSARADTSRLVPVLTGNVLVPLSEHQPMPF